MKVTRRIILWATMLCLLSMIGCSRETPIGKNAQDDKGGRELSKLQEVQTELTNLANRVHACNVPSYDYVASLRKKLSEMSPSERETAFGCVEDVFFRPRLRQFPLSQRENSIPSHLPPQVQEHYREIRRNALKKAGIDPSVEGL